MTYASDGKLEIDNNLVENSIRPLALGRKNYLFAGSHDSTENAAMIYSLVGTCKIKGIDPFAEATLKIFLKSFPIFLQSAWKNCCLKLSVFKNNC